MLPEHGKMDCSVCFESGESQCTPHPEWRMINDPGAWGSSEPEYLVLGFSKGATQAGVYESGKFEDVAFAGMRPRLTQALRAMGVLEEHESAERKISDPNSNIAFGSLIRCSVSRKDKKASKEKDEDIYGCTGALITKSFKEIPQVVNACSERFLVDLPKSVRAVFFLGNGDAYVKQCQALLGRLFSSSYQQLNAMAVKADNRVWVHLTHPSGLNGHFNAWLHHEDGQGKKRRMAKGATSLASLR